MNEYPKPTPHVHTELIKAWADGAVIEIKRSDGWVVCNNPLWFGDSLYRIKPNSNYALAKISELGGDDMVDLYLYWLNGGELEYATGTHNKIWLGFSHVSKTDDPYKKFQYLVLNNRFTSRKKKRTVKQVLWVVTYEHPNIVKDCFFLDEGVEPSSFPEGYTVHKVPTCTIEVELDG